MTKYKPIIFSTPMVQEILDDRKTCTRRVMKPQPWCSSPRDCGCVSWDNGKVGDGCADHCITYPEEKYRPGDILYVRETWMPETEQGIPTGAYIYKATDKPEPDGDTPLKWKPSIFMPKEAARIFLCVIDVRPERLQNITEEQAKAEGARRAYPYTDPDTRKTVYILDDNGTYRAGFAAIWEQINAKRGYGWAVNPWVRVIEFGRCGKPERIESERE